MQKKKKWTLFLRLNTSPIEMKENNLYNNVKRTWSDGKKKIDYIHFHLFKLNCLELGLNIAFIVVTFLFSLLICNIVGHIIILFIIYFLLLNFWQY